MASAPRGRQLRSQVGVRAGTGHGECFGGRAAGTEFWSQSSIRRLPSLGVGRDTAWTVGLSGHPLGLGGILAQDKSPSGVVLAGKQPSEDPEHWSRVRKWLTLRRGLVVDCHTEGG